MPGDCTRSGANRQSVFQEGGYLLDGLLPTVVEAQQRARVWTSRAGVAELADARDLKSRVPKGACGFDPRPRHQTRTSAGELAVGNRANIVGNGGGPRRGWGVGEGGKIIR